MDVRHHNQMNYIVTIFDGGNQKNYKSSPFENFLRMPYLNTFFKKICRSLPYFQTYHDSAFLKNNNNFFEYVPISQSIFFHCSLLKEGVDIWNRNNDTLFSLMLYFCWSIPNQDTIQLRNCTDPLDTRTYNFLSFLNWYIQSMLCNQSLLKICSNKKKVS